ncbi:MAG: VWA domain-containing protein [Acidobacteriia bacterium]|nr:VWA domain-containing protein [Terriglobia bacterium]
MQSHRWLVSLAIVPVVLAAGYLLLAQQPSPDAVTPAVRITTRLVVLDVIATSKDGTPVTDLKADDFTLEDSGKKQKIAIFSLETPVPPSALPSLPPNIFSNRPEYTMPSGPLTVLLIDALNTPFTDQSQARMELIRYAATQVKPGQQTAVYALGNRLYKLQDFTSDPQVLKSAIEAFHPVSLPQHGSTMAPLDTSSAAAATGAAAGLHGLSNASAAAIAIMSQFQAEQATPMLENRIGTTLAAMTLIARELAGRPGRKNLVWVTAGFPVSLDPVTNETTFVPMARDARGGEPLPQEQTYAAYNQQVRQETSEGVRRTAALLTDAQISIYPVDARGLIGAIGISDASSKGTSGGLLRIGNDYGQTVAASSSSMLDSQASMVEIADETGGRVFKNRNDVDNCVATAGGDGGTYYTLGYYPGRKKQDNQFHKFSVRVKRPGVQLRYRRGYFAVEPGKSSAKEKDAELMGTLYSSNLQSTMVLFDAQIVPPAPAAKAQLPVRFLVRPESIATEEDKGGVRLDLDFVVAAFSPDGKLAAREGKTVATTIDTAQYAQVKQRGLLVPVEIDLSPGEYQLRLAVRDNLTGYLGTLTAHLNLPKP